MQNFEKCQKKIIIFGEIIKRENIKEASRYKLTTSSSARVRKHEDQEEPGKIPELKSFQTLFYLVSTTYPRNNLQKKHSIFGEIK